MAKGFIDGVGVDTRFRGEVLDVSLCATRISASVGKVKSEMAFKRSSAMLKRSSFHPDVDSERSLNQLLDKGEVRAALDMATRMIERGSTHVDFELGTIYERGGEGVPIDLDKAAQCDARAAYYVPCDVTAIYLARVLMKQGRFDSARRWLTEVEKYGRTARLDLGWGLFHEDRPAADLDAARKHFLAAALRGRFLGFQGYARVSRAMGQPTRALAVDCLRVIVGPCIALVLGRTAREAF